MYRVDVPLDLIADLYEAGTLGIIEHDGWLEAFFDDRETAAKFGEPSEAPEVDWVQQTKDAWPPLLVGEKFFLVAPWRTEPTPEGRIRLEINPGLQCGTGQHPCTQKCMAAMDSRSAMSRTASTSIPSSASRQRATMVRPSVCDILKRRRQAGSRSRGLP